MGEGESSRSILKYDQRLYLGPAPVTSELLQQGIRPRKRHKQLTYEEAKRGTAGMYVVEEFIAKLFDTLF